MKKERILIRRTVTFTVLFIFFSFSCFAGKPDMMITTWCGSPFSKPDRTGYLDQILTKAFKKAGFEISIAQRPAERSLYDANRGTTDGDFIRITKIGQIYPNLLIVPEHLYDMEFVVFTKRDDIKISGWKSLKPYKTGIVRGWKILEENVKYTSGVRCDADMQEELFRMLGAGRIDVAVYAKHFGFEVIDRLGLKGIRNLEPPLARKKMYLFLHKKHKNIIPALSDILKSMKADGTFSEIREKTLLK